MKRSYALLLLVAITALLTLPLGMQQSAIGYPPPGSGVDTTSGDNSGNAGSNQTFTAQFFTGIVKFYFTSSPVFLGQATANGSGVATLTAKIPSNATAGAHTITAQGTATNGEALSVTMTFFVNSTGGGLTPTGANILPWALGAMGAVVVGGTLFGLGRRKSHQ